MEWDVTGDPTKLKTNAQFLVTEETISAAVIPWLTEVDCQGAATIFGPEVARFFTIAFAGDDRKHAARRCAKALTGLKDADHKWK